MWRSTGLWFADCANPRLLRSPNWTPLMVSARWCDPLTQQLGSGGAVRSKPETTTGGLKPQFHRQVSVRNFFEIHPGLGGIPICGGGHRISSDLAATESTCSQTTSETTDLLRSARGSIPLRSRPSCGCRSHQNPIRSTLDK